MAAARLDNEVIAIDPSEVAVDRIAPFVSRAAVTQECVAGADSPVRDWKRQQRQA